MSQVKITLRNPSNGIIEVDGQRILGVKAFRVWGDVGRPALVTLEFDATELHLDVPEGFVYEGENGTVKLPPRFIGGTWGE